MLDHTKKMVELFPRSQCGINLKKILFCAGDGRVFTWGKNRDSQLGRPLSLAVDMEPTPREIAFSDPGDGFTRRAIGIASGAHHGAALVIAND